MIAPPASRSRLPDFAVIAFGSLVTLVVSGYQFGRGNHTVYLLEGLRLADPKLFTNDWFVSSTLQYHAAFSHITGWLMTLGWIEPAFLAGYVALVVLWQTAWLKLTRALGGSRLTYALSVMLYYLSAGGIGLGVYQFLQDGCFLPSNVSSVALLWGVYLWITGRRGWAGVAMGIAGFFHLNFATGVVAAWIGLNAWSLIADRRREPMRVAPMIFGTLAALVPSGVNIFNALREKLQQNTSIPLDQFVEVYVRFRHTHHFDPLGWPVALWVSFLWPIPLAVYACVIRRREGTEDSILRQATHVFVLLVAAQVTAFLFAGVWFVSETLVQLMFWRFSIYLKLLSCIGAAWLICDARLLTPALRRALLIAIPVVLATVVGGSVALDNVTTTPGSSLELALRTFHTHRAAFILFTACAFVPLVLSIAESRGRSISPGTSLITLFACAIIAIVGWDHWLGWGMTPEQVDADYRKICSWAEESTPVDVVFLVPPAETAFRLEAKRAIVVNFKHVPQLGGEILEWLKRLEAVLGTSDLKSFPRDYVRTLSALDERYAAREPEELIGVARAYSARYVVVPRDWGNTYRRLLVYKSGRYFVYDLNQQGE